MPRGGTRVSYLQGSNGATDRDRYDGIYCPKKRAISDPVLWLRQNLPLELYIPLTFEITVQFSDSRTIAHPQEE